MRFWNAIDGLMVYYEISYKETNAYRKAMNVLVKACYLPAYIKSHMVPPLSKQIRDQLEIENLWAEHPTNRN